MAELVDAVDSKSTGSNTVWVQVPLQAPIIKLELISSFYFEKKYKYDIFILGYIVGGNYEKKFTNYSNICFNIIFNRL